MTAVETFGYLCTGCPLGCRLEVDVVEGDIVEIRGFECAKGKRYARQEHTDPRRPLSSTVAIVGGTLPRLPVRTAEAVPKHVVRQVAAALRAVRVHAPVRRGDVVLTNVVDTGIDVFATRGMALDAAAVERQSQAPDVSGRAGDVTTPRDHLADALTPVEPRAAGVDDREADVAHTESAHLLADQAREILGARGFTDSQILHWADAYVGAEHSGDLDLFLAWIYTREHGGSELRSRIW